MNQDNIKKQKLLITTDTYYPKKDGVLIFIEKVLPELSKKYNITILAPKFSKREKKIKGCKIKRLQTTKKIKVAGYKSIKLSRKNIKQIKKEIKNTDIIWSQDLGPIGALSIYYAKKYKKPVINYIHQLTWEQAVDIFNINNKIRKILSKIIYYLIRHLYNRCDLLMIPYPGLEKELYNRGIATPKRTIQLGVDSKRFTPPEDKGTAKEKIGISKDKFVIGYCGRLSKEKNLETLKKAYQEIKIKIPNSTLLIVGGGKERKLFTKLKDTKLAGSVKRPSPYYQAMDIFVMPSLTETTSLATLEAMSSSLPVIVTKVGYMKDYIRDKINGIFFPTENSYILEKKIEILFNNKEQREYLSENARKTILQKFTWEKTIKEIRKALKEF